MTVEAPAIRCVVSVPASRPALVTKAFATRADAVLVDLEDAVAPREKDSSRAAALEAIRSQAPSAIVRVNAARTPWCHRDVIACAAPDGPAAIMMPKVESAADIEFLDRLLAGAEAASGRARETRVYALIESAAGLAEARAIARASPRLAGLAIGYADLGASLGRSASFAADRWLFAQDTLLTAARSAGLAAIDGPHLGVHVDDGFLAGVQRSAALGFDGKWVIHPRQVDAVVAAFTPSDAEVRCARTVLQALGRSHAAGAGAVTVDGQMVDEAVATQARRVLRRAGRGMA